MPSTFIDENAPGVKAHTLQPRGLLPVPTAVAVIVARQEARIAQEHGVAITPEARQLLTDGLTLQFYYENHTLAYRHTPQGVEVLAVGELEIGTLVKSLSQEPRLQVKIGQI